MTQVGTLKAAHRVSRAAWSKAVRGHRKNGDDRPTACRACAKRGKSVASNLCQNLCRADCVHVFSHFAYMNVALTLERSLALHLPHNTTNLPPSPRGRKVGGADDIINHTLAISHPPILSNVDETPSSPMLESERGWFASWASTDVGEKAPRSPSLESRHRC